MKGIQVKVYLHEYLLSKTESEQTLLFVSKEFGVDERDGNGTILRADNLLDFKKQAYVGGVKGYRKWGKLTLLGEL